MEGCLSRRMRVVEVPHPTRMTRRAAPKMPKTSPSVAKRVSFYATNLVIEAVIGFTLMLPYATRIKLMGPPDAERHWPICRLQKARD